MALAQCGIDCTQQAALVFRRLTHACFLFAGPRPQQLAGVDKASASSTSTSISGLGGSAGDRFDVQLQLGSGPPVPLRVCLGAFRASFSFPCQCALLCCPGPLDRPASPTVLAFCADMQHATYL